MILILSIVYLLMGSLVLWINYTKDNLPEFWSPIQPLAYICFWPTIVIANLINKIRNTTNP